MTICCSRIAAFVWVLVLGLACTSTPDFEAPSSAAASLSAKLLAADRPAADKARDPNRRPGAVLTFLGVEEGMTAIDVITMGGYYTEALSTAVGPEGRVYAHNNAFVLSFREGAANRAITKRLEGARLPNVVRWDREFEDLGLEPGSVDVAITALNLHDLFLYGPGNEGAGGTDDSAAGGVLRALHQVLAEDGVLGIIDHAGNPGVDIRKLHRMEESQAVAIAEAAGFELEASSDLLRNSRDDRTKNVFAEGLRGETDRFLLKFRKRD